MRILMVEDNPGDVRLLREHLVGDRRVAELFQVAHVDRLALALESLERSSFEVVLLDLSLPDSQGIGTLNRMHEARPGLAIVVLTSIDDEVLGLQLLQSGAQDYLVKGEVTSSLLRRSLRYAVEHRDIIERFGRFPHRNPVLGRETTPEEQRFLDEGGFGG